MTDGVAAAVAAGVALCCDELVSGIPMKVDGKKGIPNPVPG